MTRIELSAGTIEYEDTGGDGPVVVLLHGLMMDASLWDGPIAGLSAGHRCVAPTLPFGAHRYPASAGADLSLPGLARLVAELLDRLDLRDVTLVGNDTGGALVQLLTGEARVGRAVLVVWAGEDRVMPPDHGRRLADLLHGRHVEIEDSYTLLPLDQPARLAQVIREFIAT
jgi:pimeloyl-ACP methyl ester carboxylesterase